MGVHRRIQTRSPVPRSFVKMTGAFAGVCAESSAAILVAVEHEDEMRVSIATALFCAFGTFGSLIGCDSYLTFTGKITRARGQSEQSCELALWAMYGPIWRSRRPGKLDSVVVGDHFNVRLFTGGFEEDHWVELTCSGYEVFRSARFRAPSVVQDRDLGEIELVPLSAPSR